MNRRRIRASVLGGFMVLTPLLLAGCGTSSASDAPTATPAASATVARSATPAKRSSTPVFLATPTTVPTYAVPVGTAIPAHKVALIVNGTPMSLRAWEQKRDQAMRDIWATDKVDPLSAAGKPKLAQRMRQAESYFILTVLMQPYIEKYHLQMSTAQLKAAQVQYGGPAGLARALAAAGITMAEYRQQVAVQNAQYYIINHHQYAAPTAHLLQIVVNTRSLADTIYTSLTKGADFAQAARADSVDPASAPRGGDAGYLTAAQLPAGLASLAFSLPLKQPSHPVQAGAHYFIIEVIDRRPATPLAGTSLAQAQIIYWEQWYAGHARAAHVQTFVTIG